MGLWPWVELRARNRGEEESRDDAGVQQGVEEGEHKQEGGRLMVVMVGAAAIMEAAWGEAGLQGK